MHRSANRTPTLTPILLSLVLLALAAAPGAANAAATRGASLARLAPTLEQASLTVGQQPVHLTADLHRKRGTALVAIGSLTAAGGAILALPVAFMMTTMALINPAAFAVGLAMLAGGTTLAVLGGRDLHRSRVLAAEQGDGTEEQADRGEWVESVPPPGVVSVPLLRF